MEQDVLRELHMQNREEVVVFLKRLWREEPQPCPICNGQLDFLHKKAKKSSSDWVCTSCGKRYDTFKILNNLNER